MSDSTEVRATDEKPSFAPQGDNVAPVGAGAPLIGSRFRFERRSSYCAETAWVWQRARFLCEKPQ
jgi:hypothetical protein